MKYLFFPFVVARTPLYSFQEHGKIEYAKVLSDKVFQTAIFLTSESLFGELAKHEFDYESLPDSLKRTVRKYFNRASYRATPFGLFSTFSVTEWGRGDSAGLVLENDLQLHIKPDYFVAQQFLEQFGEKIMGADVICKPNQTLFITKRDIRYTSRIIISENQSNYEMVSLSKNKLLKKLLQYCRPGRSVSQLKEFLAVETNGKSSELSDFILRLLQEQVLLTSLSPTITGEDNSNALKSLWPLKSGHSSKWKLPVSLNGESDIPMANLISFSSRINSVLTTDRARTVFYAIGERNHLTGGLSDGFRQQIEDGLYCLERLSSVPVNTLMERFIRIFKERYDQEEVPLLEVLDPQLGIGYGSFGDSGRDGIISSFLEATQSNNHSSIKENTDILTVLLNEWHRNQWARELQEIEITPDHLAQVGTSANNTIAPPSISVLFRVSEEKVVIEQAGGVSALALLGRFSWSSKMMDCLLDIARMEANNNPDIVFAEIAHVYDMHTANINRRRHLREYEIPVLVNSSLPLNKQILLEDLMVSVRGNIVLLRSRKLNKRIIPRLGTAYNYTKNVLPVFRFLCDIQNQGIRSDLSLNLSAWVPNLKYYPRVRFKDCILHLAEWHFSSEDFEEIWAVRRTEDRIRWMMHFRELHRLPRQVAFVLFDNFLVFDLDRENDIEDFLLECKNKPVIVIREFPYTTSSSVKDNAGRPFVGQFIASLFRNNPTYSAEMPVVSRRTASAEFRHPDDWIFFKIYCHPTVSNELIADHLFPWVRKKQQSNTVKDWFWIRYRDPDYHIRLRVRPHSAQYGRVYTSLYRCLQTLHCHKVIQHFQTDIYKREIARYSVALMEQVELIFQASSNMVALYLANGKYMRPDEMLQIKEGVNTTKNILLLFNLPIATQETFCKDRFNLFWAEMGKPRTLKRTLESLFKAYRQQRGTPDATSKHQASQELKVQITAMTNRLTFQEVSAQSYYNLVGDIIHMHINRLFEDNNRYFEMIIYFLLYRELIELSHKSIIPKSA